MTEKFITENKNVKPPQKQTAQHSLSYEKIAVTGGIGSGKSTVCELLKQAGYPVFSCDEIYSQMLDEPDFTAAMEILFPGCVTNGAVDKATLFNRQLGSMNFAFFKIWY